MSRFTDDEIARIGRGLFDRTLPKPKWSHAGHVAAAIWVLAARPDLRPERDMPPAIRAYNEATGVANTDTGGYHETITLASLRAIAAILDRHPGSGLGALHEVVLANGLAHPDWLLAYWSRRLLFSAEARRRWTAPDLAPFPW